MGPLSSCPLDKMEHNGQTEPGPPEDNLQEGRQSSPHQPKTKILNWRGGFGFLGVLTHCRLRPRSHKVRVCNGSEFLK